MKKINVLIIFCTVITSLVQAQIVQFNFNNPPYIDVTSADANISVSNIQLSTGTIQTNISTGGYFADEPYLEVDNGWVQTDVANAKYFYFTIDKVGDATFSISNISYDVYVLGGGPSAISCSINDNVENTTDMPSSSLQQISVDVTGYDNLSTTTTIKILGWNNGSRALSGTETVRIDNLVVQGSVVLPANDTSSFIKQTDFVVPNNISSLSNNAFTPVFEFEIGDSASGDGLSTFIDSIALTQRTNNQFSDFISIIDEAKLVSNAFADSIDGVVYADSIAFNTLGAEIQEGLLNTDTCKLVVKLKQNLTNADNKQLEFQIDSSNVFCNPSGSKVGWGNVSSGVNKLNVEVTGTQLNINVLPQKLWQDSLFEINIQATDLYGNIDKDETGNVSLVLSEGDGVLQSNISLSGSFLQGEKQFAELYFTASDTASITIESDNLTDTTLADLLIAKAKFTDDLELDNLNKWINATDWTTSNSNAIDGTYSLKHNLSGVAGTSYISEELSNTEMDSHKTVWQLVLANGNFNPTSSNRFWYNLMVNEADFTSATNYGYVVGVNFEGTTDTLCLWKLEASGTKTKLAVADFKWAEQDTVAIEVIREPNGIWQIGYKPGNNFNKLTYSHKVEDNSFVNLLNHGLVFQYTSTRAGLLMADNISVGQYYIPPAPANDSSSFIKQTDFSVPNNLWLVNENLISVLEFEIGDSASGDGLSTFVDSLVFTKGPNNEFANFTTVIDEAKLVSSAFADTITAIIYPDSLSFNTAGFEVSEGLLNTDTCKLLIKLKSGLSNADGKQFEFAIDSSKIYCNASGSKVGWGNVTSGLNKLTTRNNDSTSFVRETNFIVPEELSSISNAFIPVFEFEIGDSATADGLSTVIDSLAISKGLNNHFSDFTSLISAAKLVSTSFTDTIDGTITADSIVFKTPSLEVNEGAANADTCKLLIKLNSDLANADAQQFEFKIDSAHVYSNASGSKVAWGSVLTGVNRLLVQVEATELNWNFNTNTFWQDSLFSLNIEATDIHGNIDKDETGILTLSLSSGEGELQSNNVLSDNFANGQIQLSNLYFTGSDTASFIISSDNFADVAIAERLFSKAVFADDFESKNLTKWLNTNDWQTSSVNAIEGSYSLKHIDGGIEDTSYLSNLYPAFKMDEGVMYCRMILANGNFNPTSSNRFWYYVMASQENLESDSIYGYAIGVNFLGTTDSLSLWRVDKSGYKSQIAVANFKWEENDTIVIEVVRKPLGEWKIGYTESSDYSNLAYSDWQVDNNYSNLPNHGLVFQYSSTRAGLLMADDISIGLYNTAPKLKAVEAQHVDTIVVEFSEAVSETEAINITNYQLTSSSDAGANIQMVLYNSQKTTQVKLIVNRLKTANYSIEVSGIKDLNGSVMAAESKEFSYEVLAQKYDVVFNEIMFDPTPVVGLPETDYLEIYNRSDNPINLNNWELYIDDEIKTLPDTIIEIGEFVSITSSSQLANFAVFGKCIGKITSSELTNSGKALALYSKQGVLIDSVYYKPNWITDENKQEGGWALERIDVENHCSESLNWNASINTNGGTPCEENSIAKTNTDTRAPKLENWNMTTLSSFEFNFNEELDVTAIETNTFLSLIPNDAVVDSLQISDNKKSLKIFLNNNLHADTAYKLSISGLNDLCTNAIVDTTIETLFHAPEIYDIVINEIMADWKPSNGLPESDYLELYNRSNYDIDLSDWELWFGTTRKILPNVVLNSGAYLIICPTDETVQFTEYGSVVEAMWSNSLTNSDKAVVLKDTSGLVIDSVYYQQSWYHIEDKEDGGWSMERIDPENHCGEAANWRASENAMGGTPGAMNSIYAENIDSIAPKITTASMTGNRKINFEYSESISNFSNQSFMLEQFELDSVVMLASNTLSVYFDSSFSSGETYSITVHNITDNCGNSLADTSIQILYYQAQPNDVVINEIMADPTPSNGLPESDYLELYNRSTYPINLSDWELCFGSTRKIIPDVVLNSGAYLIICPSDETVQFTDFGLVVEAMSSSSLTNSDKAIVLKDTSGLVIDSVYYQQSWYHNEDKEDGGWSMERIDPENYCGEAANWSASENFIGGTPGVENSVLASNIDTDAPTITAASIVSQRQVNFEYSEAIKIYTNASFALDNFEIDSVIPIASNVLAVYFDSSFISGNMYSILVQDIADNCGNSLADTSVQLLYYLAQANDIVINEIYADTSPSVGLPPVEYIEIYNRSAYPINLNKWKLHYNTHPREFNNFTLESGGYLILSEQGKEELLSKYGTVMGILTSSTLSQAGRNLILEDAAGKLITQTKYKQSWFSNPEKDNGGWSLERIDPDNTCSGKYNWTASEGEFGGTPGKENSVKAVNIDNIIPYVINSNLTSENTIHIVFSEPIQISNLKDEVNYAFESNDPKIDSVGIVNVDNSEIIIHLGYNFQFGESQKLMVSGLSDLCNNLITETELIFTYNSIDKNDVVITEIMADPSPTVELPEAEYFELYNRSNKTFNIEGWQLLINENKPLILPSYTLKPDSFVLVTANSNLKEFTVSNKVGVLSFSIPNEQGMLKLVDTASNTLNKVSFNDTWYDDKEKSIGGYSLEIIDPDNQCGEKNNWKASVSNIGGTPGSLNSIDAKNVDRTKPQIANIIPLNNNELLLKFSEPLNDLSLIRSAFTIEGKGNPNLIVLEADTIYTLLLYYVEPLIQTQTYSLQIKDLTDYCGNVINDTAVTFINYSAKLYDVVINEIMANPSPSVGLPENEYIELYNRTKYPIYMTNWNIIIGNSMRIITNNIIQPNSYVIISKQFFTNNSSHQIIIPDLPNLPQSGNIYLTNQNADLICQTNYQSNWITDDLKQEGGYSLERIDYNNPNESSLNWTASVANIGGTPGTINSVFSESPDETPPNLLRVYPENDTAIILEFSEAINTAIIEIRMFNIINHPELVASWSSEFFIPKQIQLQLSEPLNTGVEYHIEVSDSLTDIAGNMLLNRTARLMLPVKASPLDIVINEILWDPFDGGVDFVELHNRSAFTVNLKQFYLASYDATGEIKSPERITEQGALLFPNEFIVLSENGELVKKHYWCENENAFYNIINLPSLPNGEGSIVLLDTTAIVIDELQYSNEMHFALINDTKGVSLERVSYNRPSNEQSNWHSASEQLGWATPGYENSQYQESIETGQEFTIEEDAFTPDNDGVNDVLYINYKFDEPGYVANAKVFNAKGKFIAQIAENELLANEGVLHWDGLSNDKKSVLAGVYIVFIEVFDINGNVKKYQKICAVNRIFD